MQSQEQYIAGIYISILIMPFLYGYPVSSDFYEQHGREDFQI